MKYFKLLLAKAHQIRKEMEELTSSPILRVILFLPLVLVIIMLLILGIYFKKLPPLVPLYYSLPWGEDQLTAPYMLLLLPLGSLLWYILSIFLIHTQMKEHRVYAQLILIAQVIVTIMAILTELNILQLII